jgi:hypothetical protein
MKVYKYGLKILFILRQTYLGRDSNPGCLHCKWALCQRAIYVSRQLIGAYSKPLHAYTPVLVFICIAYLLMAYCMTHKLH